MSASKYKAFGDPELVAMCLQGDAQAWEALIVRYRRLIYSIPSRFGFAPSDSSDVFQAVCVKLIEHLQDLKDENKVSSWLITTTTRQCIHVRSLKHREPTAETELQEPEDPTDNLEEMQIVAEHQQNVRDAVEELPEKCRNLIAMLYFDPRDPTYEEVSEALKMPVASIGPTRARCFDKLRMVLRRRGIQQVE